MCRIVIPAPVLFGLTATPAGAFDFRFAPPSTIAALAPTDTNPLAPLQTTGSLLAPLTELGDGGGRETYDPKSDHETDATSVQPDSNVQIPETECIPRPAMVSHNPYIPTSAPDVDLNGLNDGATEPSLDGMWPECDLFPPFLPAFDNSYYYRNPVAVPPPPCYATSWSALTYTPVRYHGPISRFPVPPPPPLQLAKEFEAMGTAPDAFERAMSRWYHCVVGSQSCHPSVVDCPSSLCAEERGYEYWVELSATWWKANYGEPHTATLIRLNPARRHRSGATRSHGRLPPKPTRG